MMNVIKVSTQQLIDLHNADNDMEIFADKVNDSTLVNDYISIPNSEPIRVIKVQTQSLIGLSNVNCDSPIFVEEVTQGRFIDDYVGQYDFIPLRSLIVGIVLHKE